MHGILADIDNSDELVKYLKKEFEYCECVGESVLYVLFEILSLAQSMSEDIADDVQPSIVKEKLENVFDEHGGYFALSVFFLEKGGYIEHDFSIIDISITEKGKLFLEKLKEWVQVDE